LDDLAPNVERYSLFPAVIYAISVEAPNVVCEESYALYSKAPFEAVNYTSLRAEFQLSMIPTT
jgi:hypothetical protein